MKEIKYCIKLQNLEMSVHCLPGVGLDSNIYVVTGNDPFIVDTGTGIHIRQVIDQISRVISPQKIGRIVLTHRHYDHIGGARFLMKEFGAEVYIHNLDAPPLREGDGWATLSELGGIKTEPIDVKSIREGDVFSSGDHEFRVYHTPGHTAGSIVLFDDITGSLICGDTVFVGSVGRWDLPSGDYDELVKSLHRLLSLDAVNLYPGHGPFSLGDAKHQILSALRCLGEV
ncbi:MAG: MBL fold metallo-hydrolase [Methanomassiliicoccales archaeon]|jgi:glyoxylase-like metal-dependent hydrolase (beta-lactamase superfamily II)|nr:MBL fold metallo-hydrolase [Methanomassiliicoccales archaeon]